MNYEEGINLVQNSFNENQIEFYDEKNDENRLSVLVYES